MGGRRTAAALTLCLAGLASCRAYDREAYSRWLDGSSGFDAQSTLDASDDAAESERDRPDSRRPDAGNPRRDAEVALDAPPEDVELPVSRDNQIINGSFEQTGPDWLLPWRWVNRAPAISEATQDGADAPHGAYSLWAHVTEMSAMEWHAQLVQAGLRVEAGREYTVSFSARATADRRIALVIQLPRDPYTGHFIQAVNITTTWQRYSYTFTAPTTDDAQLAINVGESVSDVWLDDFVLSR